MLKAVLAAAAAAAFVLGLAGTAAAEHHDGTVVTMAAGPEVISHRSFDRPHLNMDVLLGLDMRVNRAGTRWYVELGPTFGIDELRYGPKATVGLLFFDSRLRVGMDGSFVSVKEEHHQVLEGEVLGNVGYAQPLGENFALCLDVMSGVSLYQHESPGWANGLSLKVETTF